MPIKRRVKIKQSPAAIKRAARKRAARERAEAIERMGALLEAGHGDEKMAGIYFRALFGDQLAKLQSIAAEAETARDWSFMEGSVKQATDLYVLTSVLYEKFPEHVMLSDGAFDALAQFLIKHKDTIDTEFWNWYNVTSMGLKAGSGYNLVARPNIKWMVYILTGIDIGGDNEPHDKARLLRKSVKRKRKPTAGSVGRTGGIPVRKRKQT